jgi:Tfp pilus assembly protein PilF
VQPWAASPHLQLALVREQTGDLLAARDEIASAIDDDRSDWRLWLVQARLETKSGAIDRARSSLRHAMRLNPRSPLFASQ